MAETKAAIHHLKRLDLYKTVKPYIYAYDVPSSIGPTTNHSYESCNRIIHDAQGDMGDFSMDVHGFALKEWKTNLASPDFDDNEVVESKYRPEVLRYVEQISPPGCQLHILNHVRRKCGPDFPKTREKAGAGILNPVIIAHSDYTEFGAKNAIHRILDEHPEVIGHKFDIINVWRPTKGPNKHWPLAVCDFQTLDRGDIETSDVIHETYVGESVRLYANPDQQWHYLDGQTTDQVIVFRSVAMDGYNAPFCVHSSFARSEDDVTASANRESIEVRVVRFFRPEADAIGEQGQTG